MSKISIIKNCKGLNTKDHPTRLYSKNGSYLSKAINVDITDTGAIKKRHGYSNISEGYTEAHSLESYLDRYAIYADQSVLYAYDTDDNSVTELRTDITPDRPISYTQIGQMLAYTNGNERGLLNIDGGVLTNNEYFLFVNDPTQEQRGIVEYPMTDIFHYFSGSMYGALRDEQFVYCSEPYKPAPYDPVGGYLYTEGKVKWINSTLTGLLVGTDMGIFAYQGTGIHDFKQRRLSTEISTLSSDRISYLRSDYYGNTERVEGVLALCRSGIVIIDDALNIDNLTEKISFDWGNVSEGAFGQIGNNYIFSGVTT